MNYTAREIVAEGFKRAGRCMSAAEMNRGESAILTDVKHDIWLRRTVHGVTQLRSLAADCLMVCKVGVSRYALPEQFNEAASLNMYWGRTATITAAGSSSVECADGADLKTTDQGRRIVWLGGVAEAFSQEIATIAHPSGWEIGLEPAFEDDKVATVGSSFMLVDRAYELDQVWHDEPDRWAYTGRPAVPRYFYIHNEKLHLDCPPDKAYALRLRYYADITRIAEGSAIDLRVNRRWSSVLIKGVQWIASQEIGDTLATAAYAQYEKSVRDLIWQEQERGADDQRMGFVPWR